MERGLCSSAVRSRFRARSGAWYLINSSASSKAVSISPTASLSFSWAIKQTRRVSNALARSRVYHNVFGQKLGQIANQGRLFHCLAQGMPKLLTFVYRVGVNRYVDYVAYIDAAFVHLVVPANPEVMAID